MSGVIEYVIKQEFRGYVGLFAEIPEMLGIYK